MSREWLDTGLRHGEEEWGIARCVSCKRRMEVFDDDPEGFTSKGRRKYYYCEDRRPQRCATCGLAAQERNNAHMQEAKPAPATDTCIICGEPLVHPGRKGVRPEEINITMAQWRKGNSDRRCNACSADHKKYHAKLRARACEAQCSGTGGTSCDDLNLRMAMSNFAEWESFQHQRGAKGLNEASDVEIQKKADAEEWRTSLDDLD